MQFLKFTFLTVLLSHNQTALAKRCKTKSAAADYICDVKGSKHQLDLKYRYRKAQPRSLSIEYQKDQQGPYSQESFILKVGMDKTQKPSCKAFGLWGKCVRKKFKVCSGVLKASQSETYGLFNGYKYKRSLSFDMKKKEGVYTYLRKTPKASPEHQLESFQIEFKHCELQKEY